MQSPAARAIIMKAVKDNVLFMPAGLFFLRPANRSLGPARIVFLLTWVVLLLPEHCNQVVDHMHRVSK